ncbi:hypothetical protein PACTADRAFT_18065 [Pachysolen tannophilus NRRL Y-2460]|uniref:Uncharacterized protein n=1 Tax=Pachysolen tannophilus NRRL Y-2460 TaxID=669874 RepID=A0A1E4TRH2_PACTA|nr:hypothetical protein PACTADRAFT_18065 [Pachysolen tannophilus NRRL Y-2460]
MSSSISNYDANCPMSPQQRTNRHKRSSSSLSTPVVSQNVSTICSEIRTGKNPSLPSSSIIPARSPVRSGAGSAVGSNIGGSNISGTNSTNANANATLNSMGSMGPSMAPSTGFGPNSNNCTNNCAITAAASTGNSVNAGVSNYGNGAISSRTPLSSNASRRLSTSSSLVIDPDSMALSSYGYRVPSSSAAATPNAMAPVSSTTASAMDPVSLKVPNNINNNSNNNNNNNNNNNTSSNIPSSSSTGNLLSPQKHSSLDRRLSNEELIDIMEKEQDAIVLRLMKEITSLREENKSLKQQLSSNCNGSTTVVNGGSGAGGSGTPRGSFSREPSSRSHSRTSTSSTSIRFNNVSYGDIDFNQFQRGGLAKRSNNNSKILFNDNYNLNPDSGGGLSSNTDSPLLALDIGESATTDGNSSVPRSLLTTGN